MPQYIDDLGLKFYPILEASALAGSRDPETQGHVAHLHVSLLILDLLKGWARRSEARAADRDRFGEQAAFVVSGHRTDPT